MFMVLIKDLVHPVLLTTTGDDQRSSERMTAVLGASGEHLVHHV
jgi:hypothetical protein